MVNQQHQENPGTLSQIQTTSTCLKPLHWNPHAHYSLKSTPVDSHVTLSRGFIVCVLN